MDNFTSTLSLQLYIIQLSESLKKYSEREKRDYLDYVSEEFFAIDDEFSIIFEYILSILKLDSKEIENRLDNILEGEIDTFKLELCVKACLDYLQ
jgi:hypothetical protein